MKDKVLEINKLNFAYGKGKNIYNNFSLCLHRGEIVSIVGESGSGKSTLFELITHNLKPNSGTITSLKLSSIYQDPYSSFHPSYSIMEQIVEVMQSDISLIDRVLQRISLPKELLSKKPHQLSGGQLQRCSILRAIVMESDVILADEPTSALDNVIALDVMKILIEFLDSCGILLITHDEALARWCSDTIIHIGEQ